MDARLLVLKDTLAVRAESLRIARRRAEVGYSTNLEREQAEAEFHGTEQQIPITELAITRQEDGLSLLLGDNPRAIERGQVLSMINIPQINAGLPSGLLSGVLTFCRQRNRSWLRIRAWMLHVQLSCPASS